MKLKHKAILSFGLFIIGPFLVVGWMSAFKAEGAMRNEVGKTMLQLVRQNHLTIEKTLSTVNETTRSFLYNQFFSGSRSFGFWSGIDTLGEMSEADAMLEHLSSDGTEYTLYLKNTGNVSPIIDTKYKKRGFVYADEAYSALPSWADETSSEGGRGIVRLIEDGNGLPTVAFMRSILSPMQYDQSVGLLVVSKLEVLLNEDLVSVQLPEGTVIYWLNEKDETLMQLGMEGEPGIAAPAAWKRNREGFEFADEGSGAWLYAYSFRPKFGTSLIYRIPVDAITGNLTTFQWTIMAMSAAYLVFVLSYALYLLRVTLRPLSRLIAVTKIYEPGTKVDIGIAPNGRDEFGALYGSFQKMIARLDQSVEENYVMKIRQNELELSTLHSQITPHLLYNTLDSIYWYAIDSGNTDVGGMVKDLSRLLRIGLSKGRTIITIAEELEHVQAYTRLQMKRYPNTFRVDWDIAAAALPFGIPKVVLQPLVENAIFHGVSSMDGEGEITIRIHVNEEDGSIRLTVEDNGFIASDIGMLNEIANDEAADKGYGVRNVQRRIRLHYGEAYGLTYTTREGGGVAATICIPRRPMPD